MPTSPFTVIDDGTAYEVEALITGDSVRVPIAALGFEVKPGGLCRGPLCYPLPEGSYVVSADGLDLDGFSALTRRPLAVDRERAAAFLGTAPDDRAASLTSLEAPDFTLPALDGTLHSLSDSHGKKRLLVAYASW